MLSDGETQSPSKVTEEPYSIAEKRIQVSLEQPWAFLSLVWDSCFFFVFLSCNIFFLLIASWVLCAKKIEKKNCFSFWFLDDLLKSV